MLLKQEIYHVCMMLKCNLKLVSQAVLLAKAHKVMCTSMHDMRIHCAQSQSVVVLISR